MQLIVLGMHRSGTSAVTRLLNMAGAYFGPEGISNGADEGNPKGFWERLDVRRACDGLLHESGFDWWKVADFSLDRISEDTRERHVRELGRIVLELDAHRPWVVKEPRLCLLFPLVRPLLELPVCVHVTREPLEIAASLHTRNGFPPPVGLSLWEQYARHAIEASTGLPRVHVRYEDVMSAPVDTVRGLVERLTDLGVFGLRVPTEREITAYIDAGLHRARSSSADRRLWMNDQQVNLAAALDDGSALDGAVPGGLSPAALDQLRAFESDRARRARSDELREEIDKLRVEVDEVRGEVERRQHEVEAREDEVDRRRQRLDDVEARADAVGDRATAACDALDVAADRLQVVSTARTWRLAHRAAATRPRLTRRSANGRDPLEGVQSIVDRARRDLRSVPRRGHPDDVKGTTSVRESGRRARQSPTVAD